MLEVAQSYAVDMQELCLEQVKESKTTMKTAASPSIGTKLIIVINNIEATRQQLNMLVEIVNNEKNVYFEEDDDVIEPDTVMLDEQTEVDSKTTKPKHEPKTKQEKLIKAVFVRLNQILESCAEQVANQVWQFCFLIFQVSTCH